MVRFVLFLRNWDRQVVVSLAARRKKLLNQIMTAATRLGDGWIWVILGFMIFFADRENSRPVLMAMGLAIALEMLVYRIAKRSFSRIRPFRRFEHVPVIVLPLDEYSFPSGHTATAFAVLGVLGVFYSWLFLPLLVLACLIGVSRVYLGAHYPSDVVAGAFLGILTAEFSKWFVGESWMRFLS